MMQYINFMHFYRSIVHNEIMTYYYATKNVVRSYRVVSPTTELPTLQYPRNTSAKSKLESHNVLIIISSHQSVREADRLNDIAIDEP